MATYEDVLRTFTQAEQEALNERNALGNKLEAVIHTLLSGMMWPHDKVTHTPICVTKAGTSSTHIDLVGPKFTVSTDITLDKDALAEDSPRTLSSWTIRALDREFHFDHVSEQSMDNACRELSRAIEDAAKELAIAFVYPKG